LEEALKIINPMSSTIFWSVIVFIALTIVLWKFVLKPVNNIISKRQSEIMKSIDGADRQREEAQKYLEEQKKQLEEAKREARKIIEEGKAAARSIGDEIEQKTHEKSRAMIDSAVAEIRIERERAINEIKNKIVEIAFAAAEKMIAKSLSGEDHKKLINESLEEVGKIDWQIRKG